MSFLFKDFLEKEFGVDSRLGYTLKSLFCSPGQAAIDYARGKRQRYVSPIKLYFAVCVAFVFAFQSVPGINVEFTKFGLIIETHSGQVSRISTSLMYRPILDLVSSVATITPEARNHIHKDGMLSHASQALVGLVPLFAFCLSFFFRGRFFQEHLIATLYFNCVALIILSIGIIPWPVSIHGGINDVLNVFLAVYGFLTLSKFYGKSKLRTGLTVFALALVYAPLITASFYWGLRLQIRP